MMKDTKAKWGNRIGYVLLPFNIAIRDDPLDYVREAKATVDRKKHSLEAIFTFSIAEMVLKLFGIKAWIIQLLTLVKAIIKFYCYFQLSKMLNTGSKFSIPQDSLSHDNVFLKFSWTPGGNWLLWPSNDLHCCKFLWSASRKQFSFIYVLPFYLYVWFMNIKT